MGDARPEQAAKERADPDVAEDAGSGDARRREGARLVRHGIINAAGRLTIGAIGIVLVPIMLSGLGAEMYGVWIAALALCELIASIDFGLGWSVTRAVARGTDSADTARFAASAANALVLLGLVGAIVVTAAGYWMTSAFGLSAGAERSAPAVFLVLGIALAGEALIGYLNAILYGLRYFGMATAFQVLLAFGRAAGIVAFLMAGFGVLWLAIWHAASTWLAGVAGVVALVVSRPAFRFRPGRFDILALRRHVGFSLASQLAALGTAAVWKAPTLLLGAMRNAPTIVPYHLGQRLPMLAYSIGWRVAEAVFPAASQHEAANDTQRSRQVLLVGTRWSVLATLPLLVVMSGIAPWFLELWLGSADPEVVTVLRITAAAVLAHLLGATALHMLWGRGRGVQVCLLVGGMAAAIIVGAWFLVPDFGARGAAWSLFVPMLVGSALLLHIAAVQCGTSLAEVLRQTLRGLFLPAVVAFGSAVQLMGWLGSGGWLPLLATCIAAGLLFAASFLAVGSRHEDRQLLFEVMFGHATRADGAPSDGMLKRLRWLRSLRDFLANLRYYLYDESHTRPDHYQALFRDANDPWRYRTSPERGSDRFAAALEMLDAVRPEGRLFGEVLEIGCAEGLFTELLASRCDRLLAVDVSDIALGRARDRCRSIPDVSFRSWDLLRDPPLADRYDLVVVMAVLDNFVRIRQQKLLRGRIVDLVRPGGYLLVESTRTGGDLEDTWWRRAFHRGKWLNHYVAQHPALETIEVRITPICVQTLCRKRS